GAFNVHLLTGDSKDLRNRVPDGIAIIPAGKTPRSSQPRRGAIGPLEQRNSRRPAELRVNRIISLTKPAGSLRDERFGNEAHCLALAQTIGSVKPKPPVLLNRRLRWLTGVAER